MHYLKQILCNIAGIKFNRFFCVDEISKWCGVKSTSFESFESEPPSSQSNLISVSVCLCEQGVDRKVVRISLKRCVDIGLRRSLRWCKVGFSKQICSQVLNTVIENWGRCHIRGPCEHPILWPSLTISIAIVWSCDWCLVLAISFCRSQWSLTSNTYIE